MKKAIVKAKKKPAVKKAVKGEWMKHKSYTIKANWKYEPPTEEELKKQAEAKAVTERHEMRMLLTWLKGYRIGSGYMSNISKDQIDILQSLIGKMP